MKEHLGVKWEQSKNGQIKITWPSGLIAYCAIMSDEEMISLIESLKKN